ncbi:NAD(P)H-binding protein [uncultured Flavobacterium sp.]|uniref:NAD(P)H-binding protein n=1 Tax=uncultured Flavobacterium sp. TaxID=165435 RepID=UPI002931C752|nr:NAD(P)H-binding protein [uncultured Flavobacterium sp.]
MKALVIGATGSIGKFLVDELLEDAAYRSVVIFVRKATSKVHPKLTEHVVNFSHLDAYRELIMGDVAFSALGTTLKVAMLKEKQWRIGFDIPARFAELARENGIASFVLVSSLGASPKSRIFYSKIKGKLEERIAALYFEQYIIFKPGPLIREDSQRMGEKIIIEFLVLLNSLGLLIKFRPLPAELLAEKLAKAPEVLPHGNFVIKPEEIFLF